MNARISLTVENSKNNHIRALDQEIDEVRKSTKHRSMDVAMDSWVDPWVVGEASKEIGDCAAELDTEPGLLFVVPVLGLFEVTLGEASNDDVVLHRLRRRSATSLQGDSAPGSFCRSSKRRSSSERCESETGRVSVPASSATVSQIAATSSILSWTLRRRASSRSAVFIAPSYLGRAEAHNDLLLTGDNRPP